MREATASPDIYDVVVVGLGPAGVTAAIYAYRKRLKTLLLGKDWGGAVLISGDIENWPGVTHTTGTELAPKFEEQIRKYCTDVSCFDQVLVERIFREEDLYRVVTANGKDVRTKTVVYAAGSTPRKLGVPGEEQYRNKGVSYCAVCDGPLFGGQEVAVIGGGNSALEAILMLTKISAKVTAVNINPQYRGDAIYIEQLPRLPNVEIIANGVTKEIRGDGRFATGIVVEEKGRSRRREISARGVFVEIGAVPNVAPLEGLGLALTPWKTIVVNRNAETNLTGFFAAGDVTDVRDKQIVVAAGMGCTAALSAGAYVDTFGSAKSVP